MQQVTDNTKVLVVQMGDAEIQLSLPVPKTKKQTSYSSYYAEACNELAVPISAS